MVGITFMVFITFMGDRTSPSKLTRVVGFDKKNMNKHCITTGQRLL